LTQDVASIALQARSALVADHPRPWLEEIAATAERTLAASRSAISILSSTNPPLDEMLVVVAQEAAARAGLRATVVVEPGCEPDAWAAEALVRVVRESIRNAARHGSATEVDVHVIRDHRVQLVARDNGSGFDPDRARARGTGFGLASIREQVEGLGGTFTLVSAPGQGTIVEAVFPCSPES
jgi:signal transduction histidine kinase